MSRVEVEEMKGTLTQAMRFPVVLVYDSISWGILLPLASVKRISPPVVEATPPPLAVERRSGSVREKSIGKLLWPFAPATYCGLMVISLRKAQPELYHGSSRP